MTPEEIRDEAAKKLNIFGEGQTLRAEHSDDLDTAYLQVHSELQHDGIAYWNSTDDIPTRFEDPVISLVAAKRATRYNLRGEAYQQILLEKAEAWRTIWKLSTISKMGQTEIENY